MQGGVTGCVAVRLLGGISHIGIHLEPRQVWHHAVDVPR
jgi:hypothetical protein